MFKPGASVTSKPGPAGVAGVGSGVGSGVRRLSELRQQV